MPSQCFIEIVPDRSSHTLIEVMERRVIRGTTVYSDKWKGYWRLSENGFHHFSVNHSENFVDPIHPGLHTQSIESLVSSEGFCPSYVTEKQGALNEYPAEFLYRETTGNVSMELCQF